MRLSAVSAALAALALVGCASTGSNVIGTGDGSARPKTILLGDFIVADQMAVIDHGYSVRLEKQPGNHPILERRARTAERVNDEIIATIVVALHEAGLAASAGNSLSPNEVLLSGRLRPSAGSGARGGFGPGKGAVGADMILMGAGSKQLLTFAADAARGKPPSAKDAKARDAAVAAALASENGTPEKLSPDVEAQARRLGDAIAAQVIAYARTNHWVAAPAEREAEKKPEGKKAEKKPGV